MSLGIRVRVRLSCCRRGCSWRRKKSILIRSFFDILYCIMWYIVMDKIIQSSVSFNEYTWLKFNDFGRLTPTKDSDFENKPCLCVTTITWILWSAFNLYLLFKQLFINFKNLLTFPVSRNASVSSRIRIGDFEANDNEYCRAKDAIDLYPPDNCSRSYTNLFVGGVGVK